MDDGGKTTEVLRGEVQGLRAQLSAAEREHQIVVAGLMEAHQAAEARWRRRVESLEAKLGEPVAEAASARSPFLDEEGNGCDRDRPDLLATVRQQAEGLQIANEELSVQAEELRIQNEELVAQTDILEHQKEELEHLARQLESERALLTSVLEQMPASVVIVAGPQGPILLSNRRANEIWNEPLQAESDLEAFWEIPRYHQDSRVYRKEEMPLWRSLHLGEVVLEEEFSLRHQGRAAIELSTSSAPVRDSQGRIVAGVVTHADITARKRAEEALRQSEARYRSLVELSPDAIVVHSDGLYVFANAAAAHLFGTADPDDLIGQTVLDLIHPDYREFTAHRVEQAQSGLTTELRENRILTLDGRSVDIEVTGTAITYQGKAAVQSVMRDITERKRAEAERERLLAERDRTASQLEAVLNSMSEGLIIADLGGNILAMNQAALTLRRFESVEDVQRHISEFPKIMEVRELSGEVVPVEEWPMARALRGEKFCDRELRLCRLDLGAEFICAYSGAPVLDESGQAILAIVSMRDITERKRAEEALRESQQQAAFLADLLENSSQPFGVGFPDGRFGMCNTAFPRLLGYSKEEFLTLDWARGITPPEWGEKEAAALTELNRTGQPVRYEKEYLRKDGTRVPVELFVHLRRDEHGQPLHYYSFVTDITGRQQAEAALKESEERYRSLFENSHAAMLLINPDDGAIVDANPAACLYYGYTEEELTAKAISDINLLPADQIMAGMQEARSGECGQFIFKHRVAGGEVRDVEVFSGVVHFSGQELLYSIVHDITARKVAEAERRQLLEELQASQEELQVINEELQAQAEELQAMNEELQAQTEELQDTNQDLLTAHIALGESEARFRGLFDSMTEGVALHEIIYDDKGMAVDYRILTTNPAFAAQTGLKPEQVQGQLAGLAFGADEAPYLETYAQVAQTGEPAAFETFFPPLHRHFFISATSPRSGQFITVFEDITQRKAMEEALHYTNQRLDLLAETAGQLLASDSPQQIVDTLCQKVMDFLDCQAFFNFLVDEAEGRLHLNACAGIPDEEAKRIEWLDYGVAVCGCAAQAGCRIVTEQIQTTPDPRTELVKSYGIRAYACHPLLMQGQVLGTLSFGTRTRDHFSADDLALMKAVADQVAVAMERKRGEEAVLRAKEEWERTFDAVPDFITLLDRNHRITRMNRAMTELLDKGKGGAIGKPCYKAVHGLDEPPDFCPYSHVLASGQEYTTEVQEFGRILEVSVSPIFSDDGELLGGVHVARDITAQKEMDEALKRSRDELEQRVQERTVELRDTVAQLIEEIQERRQVQEALRKQAELLELAHEAILVKDLESRVTFWSRGAVETYGWTREQTLGQVTHVLLKTRFPDLLEEIDRELQETGHWQGELVQSRGDGEEIVVASRMAVQRDEQGKPVAILEINRDVTARRRTEEALKLERQRLLAVLERIPAHVALLRPDHTFAYVNGEFLRRFGAPGSKRCYELAGQRNPCAECQAMGVFHSSKPVIWEWTGPNGNIYQMYDYPFSDVEGSPLVLEMGVDITGRKRAEEQAFSLGRMYRMLNKVNEAIVRGPHDKNAVFQQICRIMMTEGDFLLAWIGVVNRETRVVEAAAQYDLNDDYLQNITIPIDDVPEGRGPTGTAVREGRYDVCNDYAGDPRMAPWREQALARGFQSSAAFPLRLGGQVAGVLTVYASRPDFFVAEEIDLLASLADNLSFALDFMDREVKRRQAEAALRESEERLRYLASQLIHAQESERHRLALELHDDLGQSLMVLKLQIRAIEKTVAADQWRIREECAHCLNYLNGVINNVRRLARNLRPAVLEDLGLSAGLRVLAEEFRTYHEVELSLEMDDIEGLFSRDEEINIYRIFQETLTNIAKHAQASRVKLVITRWDGAVSFTMIDDGVGFNLEQMLARDPAKKGLGLAALEERVHMLGGTLTIQSQAQRGTEISILVPSQENRIAGS